MNGNNTLVVEEMVTLHPGEVSDELVWDQSGFVFSSGGIKCHSIKIEDQQLPSEGWREKQETAIGEYQDSHVQEIMSDATKAIYKLFGTYIGNALYCSDINTCPKVLDIGCGIGSRRPLYVRALNDRVNYLGLDAVDANPARDYPFICSRVETLMQVEAFKNKFDMFVFGTSLDHFEDIDEVARAVSYLAAPGAKVVFWIGLHDVPIVASQEGAKGFYEIFQNGSVLVTLLRSLRFVFLVFPRVFIALMLRKIKLKRGQNLDAFHFWYFTKKDIPMILSKFGEIVDMSFLPGTNSMFVTCRVFVQSNV